jgi:arylsulfatase A-like enzyme
LKKYRKEGRALDVAKYAAMCEWFDETCGELLDIIEQRGQTENTLVIFLCDNGWAAPSTNAEDPHQKLWSEYAQRSKSSPYENGIRTPILVSLPGKVEPMRSPDLAHVIDLFPTIAAATGLAAPSGLPGINLLDPAARTGRERVFGVTHSTHNMTPGDPDDTLQYLWCVEGDWKLILRQAGKDTTQFRNLHVWDTAPARLYEIQKDPNEKNDLAGEQPERVKRMTAEIESWRRSLSVSSP